MNRSDAEKVHERKALSAAAVHDTLMLEGREEIARPWMALAISGLAGAFSLGLSLIAEGTLRSRLPETAWAPLIWKVGYAFGFLALTLGRQQLYTESTLTAFLPLAHDRSRPTFIRVTRLWLVVLAANLIGGFLFVLFLSHPAAFDPDIHEALRLIGLDAARHEAGASFIRGIFGGWIIALMVWLMPSAESARIWIIVLLTWVLAASGLTHVVIGSMEVFYVVLSGDVPWQDYVLRYGLPTLAGNTIGGMVFVAALNRAHVAADQS